MLEFFRRYQRYFFLVVTVVIIISFSFFGTYSTISGSNYHEQVAFKAIDGTEIKRSEVDEMAIFLGTDTEDKRIFGGAWGPNFLNDGVIRKDFLQTGLAEILASQYAAEIAPDLYSKLAKEKRYALYVHPQAKFISTETAWSYFAPDMKSNFDALRKAEMPESPEAISARIRLYMGEKRLPAPALMQVLRYQEKQYGWIQPDENLSHSDLSLFGYHSFEDWFGPRFLRLISEFIINSAKIAQSKGYQVSKAEALADLVRNSEQSFQQNSSSPHLGVANGNEYFNEQLRRLGMDSSKAVRVWQQVLLFRRLFQDAGSSVFVDPLTFSTIQDYAKETIEGELYQLPKPLRFNDFEGLQRFEIYLNAVSKRKEGDLTLPKTFLPVSEVAKNNPELVQKRYLVEVSQVDKKNLQAKVTLREAWAWEADEKNWDQLKKLFPELGIKKGNSREERMAALDSLDDRTRQRVDQHAATAIVDAHPEWLDKALEDAEAKRILVGLNAKGGKSPFPGIEDRKELMALLDTVSLSGEGKGTNEKLSHYTGDNKTYFRIYVIERAPQEEIMTFAEAEESGVLEELLERVLEEQYVKNRAAHPELFQKDDKSWKALADVKNKVAEQYFAKILQAIHTDYVAANGKQEITPERAASLRFYAYMKEAEKQLMKNGTEASSQWVRNNKSGSGQELAEKPPLNEQWKLEKGQYRLDRSMGDEQAKNADVFSMKIQEWSKVQAPPNGDAHFFQLVKKGGQEDLSQITAKVDVMRRLLSDDVQQVLMRRFLAEMEDKKAISLEYLNTSSEMGPEAL